jgi:pyruvate dehydrogenase E1 component
VAHVTARLADTRARIAATDYVRAFAGRSEIRARRYVVLGTDGFGRSDTRSCAAFEVDRWYITIAALKAQPTKARCPPPKRRAISKYGIDAAKAAPWTV